nr:anthranilate synthase component I family protein [Lysinibacter cavernae]
MLTQWFDRWEEAQTASITRLGSLPVDVAPVGASASETSAPSAVWRHSDDNYLAMIEECQSLIYEGDAYQLCLTNRVTRALSDSVLDADVFARLRAASPSHHSGLIRMGATSLISSSPEQFLAVSSSGRLTTKPIKGTRTRGATAALDTQLAAELLASEKERAENLMIVDLMRNDLTRVCERGSVTVSALHRVESYAQVHQLVSTVEGQLAEGLDVLDAVRACFPAGSMTGTPKLAAMRRLASIEGARRGIYAGAFGYLSDDGAADLAMVIRSIVLTQHPGGGSTATIGTGGGITSDSVPAEELDEIKIKARALLAALR